MRAVRLNPQLVFPSRRTKCNWRVDEANGQNRPLEAVHFIESYLLLGVNRYAVNCGYIVVKAGLDFELCYLGKKWGGGARKVILGIRI